MKDGTLRQMLGELIWIGRYGLRYKAAIAWYTLLGLLGIGMSLGAGVLSKHIIDTVLKVDTIALVPAAVSYCVMQLLRIVMNGWASRINVRIRVDVEHQIRREVYEKVLLADWESVRKFHSGDILNRVDNDVASISGNVLGWVPDMVTRLVQFLGALGLILYYDPTLALLALLSAPVTLLMSGVLTRKLRSHSIAMRKASSDVMAFTEESFQNLKTLKSFGLAAAWMDRMDTVQGRLRQETLAYNRFQVRTNMLMSLVGTAVTVLCFGWGVYRLWGGYITYGTMTLFLQLAGTLSTSFSALVHMVPAMIGGATAAGRIMAITELPSEDMSHSEEAVAFYHSHREQGLTVEAKNLTYGYQGDRIVLNEISFLAQPGQVVALVGASGEGKTTLLRLMLGLLRPRSGSLTVNSGSDALDISPGTRPLFAYVPQRSAFFSGTIAENLRLLNPNATDEDLWEALELACAARFVRKLPEGLQSPVLEQGGGFSQGQLQRLMLARALVADVPVLLLDEATSALDMETERAVLAGLARGRRQRTCIVTTHRPGVIAMCDRVYRIRGGTLELLEEETMQKEETYVG